MSRITKCLIFTDLHHGNVAPDCQWRLEQIIEAAYLEEVDCVINLGDFATPGEENKVIHDMWNGIKVPHYLVLGNHDCDCHDKQAVKAVYNLPDTYYFADVKDYRFIFLDTNYYCKEGQLYDYACGDYHKKDREYIPPEQLIWLEWVVSDTDKPCILFSHARINVSNNLSGCGNYEDIHACLMRLNHQAGWQKVCVSINGHLHANSYDCWEGIHHIGINSASNIMLEEEYDTLEPNEIYDEKVHEAHPYLKYLLPYKEPLYAILTLDIKNEILKIKGKKTTFVGPTPQERKHSGWISGQPIQAEILSLEIKL